MMICQIMHILNHFQPFHMYDFDITIAEIQKFISELGAFLFVIVWVWQGEPGNMHPCNSDA